MDFSVIDLATQGNLAVDENALHLSEQALSACRIARYGDRATVVFNEACEDLEELGKASLPCIEHVICHVIRPELTSDPMAMLREYPGLSNLLVTYFRIAQHHNMIEKRALPFLRLLAGVVHEEALRAIWVVWLDANPGVKVPASLLTYLEMEASKKHARQAGIAREFLKRYNQTHTLRHH